MHHALPVFVDTDPETFQIDARKIEAAITERTACIMPVHLGGSAADMDTILAVAKKHKLPVVEDACQAHLAEWRTKKVSTLGDLGCFSFQASKNLNSGEGGAILTNSDDLYEQCKSYQNNGRMAANAGFAYVRNGANLRITEFQGALLLQQLTRLEEQSRRREQNAAYLSQLLKEIPGIAPAKMYEGCTRNSYHIYMFRYDPDAIRRSARGRGSSRPCRPREFPSPAATSRCTASRSCETRCSRGRFRRFTRPSAFPSISSRSSARPTNGFARRPSG